MTFHEMIKSQHKGRFFQVDPATLETLIEKLHQYMFVKDVKGDFVYCNRSFAAILGEPTETRVIGKSDSDYFPAELVQMFRKTDLDVINSGQDYEGEENIPFPAGGQRTVWVNKTPLQDRNNGACVGVVGIFADLTRNREQHTQRLNAKTNDLVHEVLIPMQAVTSNIENLIRAEQGEFLLSTEERQKSLKFALSQLHILWLHAENTQKHLIGDAEKQYVFRKCGLRGVLLECMDALRSTAEEKNIDIQQPRFAAGLRDYPRLEMSRPELVRAFKNIYHNAVKYSYSGRGLGDSSTYPNRWISTVVGRESDLEFFIEIQNYGIGITPEEIPRVFDEGFRGKYSIDRHRTGSGIGLSQVKKIILRHSGQVSITSERAGKPYRTTARVVLPYNQGTGVVRYDEDLEDALG